VELQGVVQVLRPAQVQVLVQVQEQQLVRVLEQELALQLVRALLAVQLAHCDRCNRVRLLS
jgi:acylphosphatase